MVRLWGCAVLDEGRAVLDRTEPFTGKRLQEEQSLEEAEMHVLFSTDVSPGC